jgi:hypothetical protein
MGQRKNRRRAHFKLWKQQLVIAVEILSKYASHNCLTQDKCYCDNENKPDFVISIKDERTGKHHWLKVIVSSSIQSAERKSMMPVVGLLLQSMINSHHRALFYPDWKSPTLVWQNDFLSSLHATLNSDQIVETHMSYVLEQNKMQWIKVIKTVLADISDLANLVTLYLTPPHFVRRPIKILPTLVR